MVFLAISVAGFAAVAVGQVLYSRNVRKTFRSLLAAKSHVLKAADAGDLCLEGIDNTDEIGDLTLVQLMDKLTEAALTADRASGEFELANKALLKAK